MASEVRIQRLERARRAEEAWQAMHAAKPRHTVQQRCDPSGTCTTVGVLVHLNDDEGVVACRDCSPATLAQGGLYLPAWHGAWGPRGYALTAPLVIGVPNDASAPLLNPVGGAIVLLWRGGGVSIASKVSVAQEAGAVGVVLLDDGTCGDGVGEDGMPGGAFQCGGWLGSKASGQRLASRDAASAWSACRIPVALVSAGQGERLLALLQAGMRRIEGHGVQYMSAS